MKEVELIQLMENKTLRAEKLNDFMDKGVLSKKPGDKKIILGHLKKAEHNLEFAKDVSKDKYFDWYLTGCYYACYHAALALIMTKGYDSKNHLATLCVLIEEFYGENLTKDDIQNVSDLYDYQDLLFYTEAKNKRESASYSTQVKFETDENMMLKAILFVLKAKNIIS